MKATASDSAAQVDKTKRHFVNMQGVSKNGDSLQPYTFGQEQWFTRTSEFDLFGSTTNLSMTVASDITQFAGGSPIRVDNKVAQDKTVQNTILKGNY